MKKKKNKNTNSDTAFWTFLSLILGFFLVVAFDKWKDKQRTEALQRINNGQENDRLALTNDWSNVYGDIQRAYQKLQ